MEATMETVEVTPGQLVSAKTICLVLKMGSFGNTKQASLGGAVLSQDDPTKEPDKALLRLSKTLLDSPELEAIHKHDRVLAAKVRAMSFASLFKGGVFLLPIALVVTVEELIRASVEQRKVLVDAAVAAFPVRVAETTARLGVAASDTDYPSEARFRASFYVEWSYVTFETPSRLKAISAALFQVETEKARVKLESVAQECEQTMRAGLLQMVEHLRERLTPTDDGKPKRLHTSTIGHLSEFLSSFELKNVTDDAQLGVLVEKARGIMQGVDPEMLRSDELVRKKVLAELTLVKAALDPLVIEKGTRAISFDDET